MRKNPFSIFDFLGYVFPGALALFLICFFNKLPEIRGIQSLFRIALAMDMNFSIDTTIFFTVVSYILGHFIAYLSSLTVEQFSIWLYGYPSDFLLKDVAAKHYWGLPERNDNLGKSHRYLARICIGLLLLPLSISSLIFAKLLRGKYFFIKKLDSDLIEAISQKCVKLAHYLDYPITGEETDFHRIIYHYEYELKKAHSIKMDNYIALYGFLRSVTFIFNCLFLYLLFFIAIPSLNFRVCIDWKIIGLLFWVMVIAYLFFMSFMKFYRRFTLGNRSPFFPLSQTPFQRHIYGIQIA